MCIHVLDMDKNTNCQPPPTPQLLLTFIKKILSGGGCPFGVLDAYGSADFVLDLIQKSSLCAAAKGWYPGLKPSRTLNTTAPFRLDVRHVAAPPLRPSPRARTCVFFEL